MELQEENFLKEKQSNVSLNLEATTARLLWIIFMQYSDRMATFIQKYFCGVKVHFSLGIFQEN